MLSVLLQLDEYSPLQQSEIENQRERKRKEKRERAEEKVGDRKSENKHSVYLCRSV